MMQSPMCLRTVAAVALDHRVDDVEEPAGENVQLLRIDLAAEPGVAREVGEQHRHLPALAFRKGRGRCIRPEIRWTGC
jgi:hypothetical protein